MLKFASFKPGIAKPLMIAVFCLSLIAAGIYLPYANSGYVRQNEILFLTEDREKRDRLIDVLLKSPKLAGVEVASLDDEKWLELSKYKAICLPVSKRRLKDNLKKYYENGVGIYIYGTDREVSSAELNKILGQAGAAEPYIIRDKDDRDIRKPAYVRLEKKKRESGDIVFIGSYLYPHQNIRINISEISGEGKMLEAVKLAHSELLTEFSELGEENPKFAIYDIDGASDDAELVSLKLVLRRSYKELDPSIYSFTLTSVYSVKTSDFFVGEVNYEADTNEIASITGVEPKSERDFRINVDSARKEAKFSAHTPALFPRNLAGREFTSSVDFKTGENVLNLDLSLAYGAYFGTFKQYMKPQKVNRNLDYNLRIEF